MNRAGALAVLGSGLAGAAMLAAARWAPASIQPAGARYELSRLVAQAVDRFLPEEHPDVTPGTSEIQAPALASIPSDVRPQSARTASMQRELDQPRTQGRAASCVLVSFCSDSNDWTLESCPPPGVDGTQAVLDEFASAAQTVRQLVFSAGSRMQVTTERSAQYGSKLRPDVLKTWRIRKG